MSKIGKIPIPITDGVDVKISENSVTVTGPKGTLSFTIPKGVSASVSDGKINVSINDQLVSNLYGLTRSMIANMIEGVTSGFEKKLELSGVGYRAQVSDKDLTLSVGFSHPVKIEAPEGITFSVKENVISISGVDKRLVGDTAAKIRSIRPPEPYKGKGIRYVGEKIRRKVGKAAKAVGTK